MTRNLDDSIYHIPANAGFHMYEFIIATGYVQCTCKLAFIVFFAFLVLKHVIRDTHILT